MDQIVISQAAELGIPKPAAVVQAEAFQAAATKFLETVTASVAPDLATATPKTVAEVFAAVVANDVSAAATAQRARELAALAEARVEEAWRTAIAGMQPAFAKAFDETAAQFVAESNRLAHIPAESIEAQHMAPDHAEIHRLGNKLDMLAMVRNYFANTSPRADCGNDAYERASRTLIHQTERTAVNPPTGMGSRGLLHWLTAARHPGITIAWQSAQQQPQQPGIVRHVQAIARDRAAMASAAEARAAVTGRR